MQVRPFSPFTDRKSSQIKRTPHKSPSPTLHTGRTSPKKNLDLTKRSKIGQQRNGMLALTGASLLNFTTAKSSNKEKGAMMTTNEKAAKYKRRTS